MFGKDFKATNGWFTRWKKWENIVYLKTQGEQGEADRPSADVWLAKEWPNIIAPADIFYTDETGLCYRELPEHSYVFKTKNAKGVKISKDRITVFCCVCMMGEKK